MRRGFFQKLGLFLAFLGVMGAVSAADLEIEFLSETTIPGDLRIGKTLVGGLSGLTYDPGCDLFYVVSDDRGRIAPARFYHFRIRAPLDAAKIDFWGVTSLRDIDGDFFKPGGLDPEGLTLNAEGSLFLTSEGVPHRGIPPFVRRISLDGSTKEILDLPEYYLPDERGIRGVRDNLGFEGLSATPDGTLLYAALENALLQDGPAADLEVGSLARLLVFELHDGMARAEYIYLVDPVPDRPEPADAFRMNGISEILALDSFRLLVVERSFSAGIGNSIRLYLVDLEKATNVLGFENLDEANSGDLRPAAKTLIANLSDFGIQPDNIEALSLGPVLPDGRRLLVMISDNNFQPSIQANQVLLFAISGVELPKINQPSVRIRDIQGVGHFSPYVGRCVGGVRGVVTTILGDRQGQAFWVQDPDVDENPATSEGLFVMGLPGLPTVAQGDLLILEGRVEEPSWGLELPVTRLVAEKIKIVERGLDLPQPIRIGETGRKIPQYKVAATRFEVFCPVDHAADFFESLEGMLVEVAEPVVVGPTSRHGEVAVLADLGRASISRTARGGVALRSEKVNPERILIDDRLVAKPPDLVVGEVLGSEVEGVLHYSFGSYKVLNTKPLPVVEVGDLEPERTELLTDSSHLTVATFNLENLSLQSPPEKYARLAGVVVENLRSPAVLAVQEIQDDSGPEDDGTVTAELTIGRLADAIESAGGPRYEARSIDPVDGCDGGQPGANIRNAFLFDPVRIAFVEHCAPNSKGEAKVLPGSHLSCSPGLIEPENPAFGGRNPDGGGSRKPLVGEFRFANQNLVLINLHFVSKYGDDPVFGRRQPPQSSSTKLRSQQADVVASYIQRLLEEDENASVVVLGDLNDHDGSPPLQILKSSGLEDLVEYLPSEDRYTYIYLGNSETLDHVLVSRSLAGDADVDIVHVSSEFPYNDRASDHDAVVVRLALGE